MRVNLYLAVAGLGGMYTKGDLLASADLEVVPGGTYTIDGIQYVLAGKPEFHISKRVQAHASFLAGGVTSSMKDNTHQLDKVDLLVEQLYHPYGV